MSFGYILRESISGFQRTKVATVGSMLTITVAVLILSIFGLVWYDAARVDAMLRDRIDLEAFLSEPLSDAKRDTIERALLSDPAVSAVEFISKERAAGIFREEFGEDAGEILDFNPFPPSYRIYLRDESRAGAAADSASARVGAIDGVDLVTYRKDLLAFLDRQSSSLRAAGLAVGALVALSALFIVANTIRLAISARRKSVQAMKLVGASRFFVRAPFILEGLIQGALGAAIAGLVIHYLLAWLGTLITGEFALFLRVEPFFYGFVLAAGMLLGLAGSLIAVAKFIGDEIAP
jgi:cell division transport system permease protein